MRTRSQGRKRIAVVGGGISGLAAAHRLQELSSERGRTVQITLLEARDRLGGVISTLVRDGFLMEAGPDSFITEKPAALRLAARMGISDRLIRTRGQGGRSFVVRGGKLHPTPDGFYLLAPSRFLPFLTTRILSPLGKLRAGLDLVIPRRREEGDESIGSFVVRRLGREALHRLAEPMVAAIYGADPMQLSLLATFPRFREMEKKHGSVIRALWAGTRKRESAERFGAGASGARYGLFATFDRGMRDLVGALADRLPAGTVRTNFRVERVFPTPEGDWRLTAGGTEEPFHALILAMPGPPTAALVSTFDPELAGHLSAIPYGTSATVSFAFREEDVRHPLDAFGFVVPSREGLSILGCTFSHRKYAGRAPAGHALLRAFLGKAAGSLSDEELIRRTREELDRLLGFLGPPLLTSLARYPSSIPHYPVGHLEILSRIQGRVSAHPGLALAGNAYWGIGVPDCVRSGEDAAEAILQYLFPTG